MLKAELINKLFILFQQGDKKLISQLKLQYPDAVINTQWHFQITHLWQFYLHFYQFTDISYHEFRKFLFNSPINNQLKAHQLSIKIAISAPHIDDSEYYLTDH